MGIKEIQKLKCQDEFLTVSKVYRTANLAHLATFFELALKIYHFSFLRFLGFGYYLREWKDFPVLLSPLEQFSGIEVTFLWDCMK